VEPEVCAFYAEQTGLRDRELHLVGVALGAASPTEDPATGAIAAIGALRGFLADLGLRPRLATLGFDDALLDTVAQDAIDDAAINNSPRLPSLAEARAILGRVA
jgi:alcohol dehydrogenase class IV